MPWRLRVPAEYFGRQYRDLVKDLLTGQFAQACLDAVQRFGAGGDGKPAVSPRRVRRRSIGADCDLQSDAEALPLGLFRSPGSNGSLLGYVFTAPPLSTELAEGDYVYCTAPPTFGHAVVELLA